MLDPSRLQLTGRHPERPGGPLSGTHHDAPLRRWWDGTDSRYGEVIGTRPRRAARSHDRRANARPTGVVRTLERRIWLYAVRGLRERCYHRLVARPSGVERCAVWGSADSGGHCNSSSASCSVGLAKSRRLRGRSLSSSATASSSASVTVPKSVPLGKYWRSRPLVFSLEPRCHGACGSQKKTSMPASTCDLLPVAHLGALVPGQRAAQRLGQGLHLASERGRDVLGLVAVGQRDEHRVAAGALDERGDRGGVALADQQIALPVAGHGAVVGLGRALGDVDHVGDAVLALAGLAARLAQRPPGPQVARSARAAARRATARTATGRSSRSTPTSPDRRGTGGAAARRSARARSAGVRSSCTTCRSARLVASLAGFGRLARS